MKVTSLLFSIAWLHNHSAGAFQTSPTRTGISPLRVQRRNKTTQTQRYADLNEEGVNEKPTRLYFDIALGDDEVGRLIFNLKDSERLLPMHTENLIKLCTGAVRSVDPRCSYVKCAFKHSPQFVEEFPQYRWAHVLDGRGRNAVGRPTDRISDPQSLRACAHSLYGGVYYGLEYNDEIGEKEGVVLTVPLVGSYRGSTSFSIVRVGESPREWRERLLLNSAVMGYLESGIDVLQKMARQTKAPPTIVASGKI